MFGLLVLVLPGWAGGLEPIAPPAADLRLGHPAPVVEPVDQTYLMRFVRKVLVQRVRDGQRYENVYTPRALAELSCRVSVTLRRVGKLVGTADSDALPVVSACREAAEAALADAGRDKPLSEDDLARLTIEVELIGPREQVGRGNESPGQLGLSFEPAIHGIAVRSDGKEVLVRPSQVISKEALCERDGLVDHRCNRYEIAIDGLQGELGLKRDPPDREPEKVVFLRFRSTHLYEPHPGSEPVRLIAGMRAIRPEEVTRRELSSAADDLARYIRYRQISDGFFSYEFLPGRGMYWPTGQNWVRQAATTWALAVHARQRKDRASNEALERAIAAFGKMVAPLENRRDAAYIATPDGKHPLGVTALVCLALTEAPDRDRHADLRASLLNALAAMQRGNGSFRTRFPPSTSKSSQDYYPGEALLAIARHYVQTRDAKWREVCDQALPFYQSYFRENRPPMFVPWQVQAWGQLARTTLLQRYADFVYEMSDFLAATQIESKDPTLRIYEGGFDVHGTGRAGISTAVYVEGYVEAVRTAEAMGDAERADRYREIIRKACRFVLQLRFGEEECYYVHSPGEVIGAVRNTPINPTLRIDHCQHALGALLGAAGLLPAATQPHP